MQLIGLGIHTFNQITLNHIATERNIATRDIELYRQVASAKPEARGRIIAAERHEGEKVRLSTAPPYGNSFTLPLPARQIIRGSILAYPMPDKLRPSDVAMLGRTSPLAVVLGFRLPDDGKWLIVDTRFNPPAPWATPGFATAFVVMFGLGAVLIFWAVFRLIAPVRTLADAAEQLGRDIVHAPSPPETGATEIATAAVAFNTMAARIRRFVEDRTFLLSAIGHDLRTPITRLKLRAEFLDDEKAREKILADLDELEAMVAATIAFGRDVTASEASVPVDLAALLRTVLDEAGDLAPDLAEAISFNGPAHLTLRGRPLALKRAFSNLVGNALKYGKAARVRLRPSERGLIRIDLEDDGPGIPPGELDRVFEPFHRVETSRNRATGGTGLGLAIARNAIRAHGGDITLANRPGGAGLTASIYLPG